jgi:hypothetical protein
MVITLPTQVSVKHLDRYGPGIVINFTFFFFFYYYYFLVSEQDGHLFQRVNFSTTVLSFSAA